MNVQRGRQMIQRDVSMYETARQIKKGERKMREREREREGEGNIISMYVYIQI